jgi:hypothetical protein
MLFVQQLWIEFMAVARWLNVAVMTSQATTTPRRFQYVRRHPEQLSTDSRPTG